LGKQKVISITLNLLDSFFEIVLGCGLSLLGIEGARAAESNIGLYVCFASVLMFKVCLYMILA